MIYNLTKFEYLVQGLAWPRMINRRFIPVQYHHASLGIAGVCVIMRKTVADVVDIFLLLTQVEMAAENRFEPAKMTHLNLAVIRHFYHGIHFKMRQLKVSKHIFGCHFLYAMMIVAYQPWRNYDIAFL